MTSKLTCKRINKSARRSRAPSEDRMSGSTHASRPRTKSPGSLSLSRRYASFFKNHHPRHILLRTRWGHVVTHVVAAVPARLALCREPSPNHEMHVLGAVAHPK